MTKTREYKIRTVSDPEELLRAPEAKIDLFPWARGGYEPESTAKLVYLRDRGFLAHLSCREGEPLARELMPDGDVYRDSCLEFFVNFAPDKGCTYLNLEGNAAGTLHCKLGEGRSDRRALSDFAVPRPTVRAQRRPDRWSVEYFIPLETVKALFGVERFAPGDVIAGNFYKCGDATPRPHFGVWSFVGTAEPDFHRPEYFGKMIIDG